MELEGTLWYRNLLQGHPPHAFWAKTSSKKLNPSWGNPSWVMGHTGRKRLLQGHHHGMIGQVPVGSPGRGCFAQQPPSPH